jgi:hypothetical protein
VTPMRFESRQPDGSVERVARPQSFEQPSDRTRGRPAVGPSIGQLSRKSGAHFVPSSHLLFFCRDDDEGNPPVAVLVGVSFRRRPTRRGLAASVAAERQSARSATSAPRRPGRLGGSFRRCR